ncbi:EamA family transporter [Flagellimonas sp. HMM57]|uniref:DMT family transporter n=1 Tax=unclassified Flagellimonas TaxID=2644544 RepID=UPI0013D35467|nr:MULTISPECIES: EamA family transporter [unclassified Flagellimonas]UII74504.1 EamA family transporter [Flagellimonas sp. HMM57]
MGEQNRKWVYLIVLSIIWGTSYILIKKGLEGFNPIQLGAIRIVMAALFLFIIGFKSIKTISRKEWPWVGVSGIIGSFVPMFLFAFAETEIDSGIASILNSLVPLFTLFIGLFIFGVKFTQNQFIGVAVGLIGAALLIFFGTEINPDQNYWYAGLVVVATICYACNANIIKSKLQDVSPMGIAVGNFLVIFIPGLCILIFSGFLKKEVVSGPYFLSSLGYIILLCILGTCVAKVMFNKLVKISSAVFSVSVTYLIPIVGVFWGIVDGEKFAFRQLLAAVVILIGVYIVNKKKTPQRTSSLKN